MPSNNDGNGASFSSLVGAGSPSAPPSVSCSDLLRPSAVLSRGGAGRYGPRLHRAARIRAVRGVAHRADVGEHGHGPFPPPHVKTRQNCTTCIQLLSVPTFCLTRRSRGRNWSARSCSNSISVPAAPPPGASSRVSRSVVYQCRRACQRSLLMSLHMPLCARATNLCFSGPYSVGKLNEVRAVTQRVISWGHVCGRSQLAVCMTNRAPVQNTNSSWPRRVYRRGPVTYTYTFTSSNNPGELVGPGLLPMMPPQMGFPGGGGEAAGGPGSLDLTNLQARDRPCSAAGLRGRICDACVDADDPCSGNRSSPVLTLRALGQLPFCGPVSLVLSSTCSSASVTPLYCKTSELQCGRRFAGRAWTG